MSIKIFKTSIKVHKEIVELIDKMVGIGLLKNRFYMFNILIGKGLE
jgi:hypothetical protein